MNTTFKTLIAGTIALAFFACSDSSSSSTAPETTQEPTNENVAKPDTTKQDTAKQDTAKQEPAKQDTTTNTQKPSTTEQDTTSENVPVPATELTSSDLIKFNHTVSNQLSVYCENKSLDCSNNVKAKLGTLKQHYAGDSEYIKCIDGSNVIASYLVAVTKQTTQLSDTTAQKTLTTNNEGLVQQFKKDCEEESGEFEILQTDCIDTSCTTDEPTMATCIVAPSTYDAKSESVNYKDPQWQKYGHYIIDICEGILKSQSNEEVRMGECKNNGLALAKESSVSTITSKGNGLYEIKIPDVSDYCAVQAPVIKILEGDTLKLSYDLDCSYSIANGTECEYTSVSKCICVSDHYFTVAEEYAKAKYVEFHEGTYELKGIAILREKL